MRDDWKLTMQARVVMQIWNFLYVVERVILYL